MRKLGDNQIQEDVKQVFEEIQKLPLEPRPYLETRVLSELHKKTLPIPVSLPSLHFWKRLAITSSVLTVVALIVVSTRFFPQATYEAFVGQPFVVRIELKNLNQTQIAKARIQLPEGVFFDLEDYPELKNTRTLTLRWSHLRNEEIFPFVLSARETGLKTVRVDFLDENSGIIAERIFHIQLKGPQS